MACPQPDGEWVKHVDYATLLARCEQAEERADVRGKLAETFGDVLCKIAGTTDRVRACATASDRFAAMEATVAACKAAGLVDANGKVVRFEKQYWRADTEGECCEDLEEIADSCGDGEFLHVVPLLILPGELYVVQVNADGTGSHREATVEERQLREQSEREWRERAKVLPDMPARTAAEAAKGETHES
jgi:hypothetical protein